MRLFGTGNLFALVVGIVSVRAVLPTASLGSTPPQFCKCANITNEHGGGGANCKSKENGRPWCYVQNSACKDKQIGEAHDWSHDACVPYWGQHHAGYDGRNGLGNRRKFCKCSNLTNSHGEGGADCKSLQGHRAWCYVNNTVCADEQSSYFAKWSYKACVPYWSKGSAAPNWLHQVGLEGNRPAHTQLSQFKSKKKSSRPKSQLRANGRLKSKAQLQANRRLKSKAQLQANGRLKSKAQLQSKPKAQPQLGDSHSHVIGHAVATPPPGTDDGANGGT